MDFLLTYILQVNLLLVIIYLGYVLMLKNLTFYQVNRGYFILGAVFSFVYPFLDIKSLFREHIEPVGEMIQYMPDFFVEDPDKANVFTLNNLFVFILGVGASIFIIRLLLQLLSLLRIHLRSKPAMWKSFLYRNVLFPIVPFSFFNKIYINKEQHQESELMDIFKHEDIHVKGRHTFDILFTEIVFITCWYNPVVWLMRKAVRQNLEFLTDQQVLDKGVDRQVYQYSLLNVSKQGLNASIANQFNFKMLKRRIMMMNKKRSSKLELSKYVFLIPVFIFAAGAFSVNQVEASIEDIVEKGKKISFDIDLKKADGQEGHVDVPADIYDRFEDDIRDRPVVHEGDTSGKPRIVIRTKNGVRSDNPLFVVDGKVLGFDYDFHDVDPNDIQEIQILKDSSATKLYGEEGKNGVVIITKKPTDKRADTATIKPHLKSKIGVIKREGAIDTVGNEKNPLFILDGEPIPKIVLSKIDPNKIESIDVLKGVTGKTLHGEAGKNGVIIIHSKKETNAPNEVVVQGYATKTSKPLVIVNGKEVALDLNSIETEKIESIKTLTKEEAKALYGDNGKHGAVIITTKAGEDLTQLQRPSISGRGVHEVTVIGRRIEEVK